MTNTLCYGDNLSFLTQHVGDATVDLVYLDPPFNSNRSCDILFKEQSGKENPAQIKAFGNTLELGGRGGGVGRPPRPLSRPQGDRADVGLPQYPGRERRDGVSGDDGPAPMKLPAPGGVSL